MGYNREYYLNHRKKILARQKQYYWNDPERYRKYSQEYRKKNRGRKIEYNKMYRPTPAGIWIGLRNTPKRRISKEDFIKWYNTQNKKCAYCGMPEEELKKKIFRCWKSERLQIDRKDNNRGYENGNLILACPVCNFIKGNYFTCNEMLKIGKLIKKLKVQRKSHS